MTDQSTTVCVELKPDYADLYRRLNDWFQNDNYWEIADKYNIPPSKEFTLSVLSEFKKMFPTLPEQCEKDIMVRTLFISRSIAIAFDATPEELADDDAWRHGPVARFCDQLDYTLPSI